MKRIASIVVMMVVGWLTGWAAELTDTVTVISNPDWVEVETWGNHVQVKAKGKEHGKTYDYTYDYTQSEGVDNDWEVNLPFFKSHFEESKKKRGGCWLSVDWFDNFYVGGVIGLDKPEGMRGGWEIGVDNLVGLFWHTGRRGPIFSLGAGLGYRSTNFGNGMMLNQIGKTLVVVPVDDELASASSRLHLFRLTVPFMITQKFGCGMALRVGAILNLNTYTSATTKIKAGRSTTKESFHSLEQRFATPDFLGSLVVCDNCGVYVRWSPVSLFSSEWGPRVKTISVGVNFVM